MSSLVPFNKQIKALNNKARDLRIAANELEQEVKRIEEKRKKVCTHPSYKIVKESYEEPGRVKYFEWQEKVCTLCGKVLATSSEKTTTQWHKVD